MIPALTEGGRSFKGAALYYLHDKREAGDDERLTTGRVAWTQTVNLPTEDAERAWRMMAHTAMAQAELKAAAGEKATGRKLTKPVFAYSLSWHPGEKPTRDDQLAAARETLKLLGLENHQAIIVAHNDEPHPHVHILVNRVDPATGKAATLSNSKLALSKWAQGYEEARGQVFCEKRVENNAKRRQGEKVQNPRTPRAAFEAAASGRDTLSAEFVRAEQRQKDAALYETDRQVRASHERQWTELRRVYDAAKTRMGAETAALKERKALDIKSAAKSRWRDLFQRQRRQRIAFEAAERGTLGKVWNLLFVYREMRRQNRQTDALTILYTLLSSAQRTAVFDAAQEGERRALARQVKQSIGVASREIGRNAARGFAKCREDYLAQCARLRQTQAEQRAVMKAAWEARNAERGAALAPLMERGAKKRRGRTRGRERSVKDDDRYRPPRRRGPGPGST